MAFDLLLLARIFVAHITLCHLSCVQFHLMPCYPSLDSLCMCPKVSVLGVIYVSQGSLLLWGLFYCSV